MRNKIAAVIAISAVITTITISSCKRDYDPVASYQTPTGNAYLHIVHAAPYFGKLYNIKDSFNVLVGGTKVAGFLPGSNPYFSYGISFPTVSAVNGYITVPAGQQEIKLTQGVLAPDSVTIKSFTKTLQPDTYYTFMITDSLNSGRDAAQIFVRDSLTNPTLGYFNLRFIHAALEDTATASQKTIDTIDVFSTRNNRNIYSRIVRGQVTGFSQFAYNSQLNDTIYIRRTRSTVNLATLNNVGFSNQRNYTLYFYGDGNATTGAKARSVAVYVNK